MTNFSLNNFFRIFSTSLKDSQKKILIRNWIELKKFRSALKSTWEFHAQNLTCRHRAATLGTFLMPPPARLIRGQDSGDDESVGSSSVESVNLDKEEFFCMMPNGVSDTVRLHLDDDVYHVKEQVVKFFRESGKYHRRLCKYPIRSSSSNISWGGFG